MLVVQGLLRSCSSSFPPHSHHQHIRKEPTLHGSVGSFKTLILSWYHICADLGEWQPHSCLPHFILPELLKITMTYAGFGCLGEMHGGAREQGGEHEIFANPLISPREADVKC